MPSVKNQKEQKSNFSNLMQSPPHLLLDKSKHLLPHAVLKLFLRCLDTLPSLSRHIITSFDRSLPRTSKRRFTALITRSQRSRNSISSRSSTSSARRTIFDAAGRVPVTVDRRVAAEVEDHLLAVQPGDVPQVPGRLEERLERLQAGLFFVFHRNGNRQQQAVFQGAVVAEDLVDQQARQAAKANRLGSSTASAAGATLWGTARQ